MPPTRSAWIRAPLWDTALLAFPWVPLYLWFVFGLRLGDLGGMVRIFGATFDAVALATFVVLAITYVHRHYTFVLVYGDGPTFASHARAYVVAPLVLFGLLALCRLGADVPLLERGALRISAWDVALVTSGTWNVWHTVQQRYGILRVYAGKAGAGLESRAHAQRDRLLVWSLLVAVALALLVFRRHTFLSHEAARRTLLALLPFVESSAFDAVAIVLAIGVLGVVVAWARAEWAAPLPLRERAPRLTFLASTLALFAVFVVHGPVVGYLTFGSAHALEYVAFVHHFGERKFRAQPESTSLAARLMRRPMIAAPLLVGGLGLAYFALLPVADSDTYLAYYLGTSMLHFLYDGWIWKVRTPEVARPLGAQPA